MDLANPKANVKNHGFTPEERAGFTAFVKAGFLDTFRQFVTGMGIHAIFDLPWAPIYIAVIFAFVWPSRLCINHEYERLKLPGSGRVPDRHHRAV